MCKRLIVTVACLVFQGTCFALQSVNPAYQVEQYCSYTYPSVLGEPRGMTFDDSGNLYVVHRGDVDNNDENSRIMKITANKDVSPLVSDLTNGRQVSWGGGTSYGNYLYVEERTSGNIYQVDTDGNKTLWSQTPGGIGAHVIDTTGNYGSVMYASSGDPKDMYTITTDGQISLFNNFPVEIGSGVLDLVIDTKGAYGGYMYARVYAPGETVHGLHRVYTDGTTEYFPTPDIGMGGSVCFDDTEQDYFNGMLYTAASDGQNYGIFSISPSGDTSLLAIQDTAVGNDNLLWSITFGDDGAMYLAEHDFTNNTTTIDRITYVPEPLSVFLLSLGGMTLIRRRKNAM